MPEPKRSQSFLVAQITGACSTPALRLRLEASSTMTLRVRAQGREVSQSVAAQKRVEERAGQVRGIWLSSGPGGAVAERALEFGSQGPQVKALRAAALAQVSAGTPEPHSRRRHLALAGQPSPQQAQLHIRPQVAQMGQAGI